VAVLVNPDNARITEITLKDAETAARAKGLQIQVFNASTSREIEGVFATLARERPDALFVGGDAFFDSRRLQLSLQAMRLAVPAAYSGREYAEAGGRGGRHAREQVSRELVTATDDRPETGALMPGG
jgi:putative ABC transport system substrate-binding protein